MKEQYFHTPDGVRDLYNGECKKKITIQQKLYQTLLSYGCRGIQTPSFEFFPIFGNEIGTTPSKDLYKFFDKEGNTLVLRPDFTPSIARCAVKYYTKKELPVKLCYAGNTFLNSGHYQGRLREITQCGAEYIGDDSVYADAEMLAMAVDALKAAGLEEFQLSVGHAQLFCGLTEAAGFDGDTAELLRDLLSNKNFLGVEELIDNMNLEDNLRKLFTLLGMFDARPEDFAKAFQYAGDYPVISSALHLLRTLDGVLKIYGIDSYVSYEPGIISSYQYYTGIIFSGYTFGTGEPIVKGGRYDRLLSYFGKSEPAIGFAIDVDRLMNALTRQNIPVEEPDQSILLIFTEACCRQAIQKASALRQEGYMVQMMRRGEHFSEEEEQSYAGHYRFSSVIRITEDGEEKIADTKIE